MFYDLMALHSALLLGLILGGTLTPRVLGTGPDALFQRWAHRTAWSLSWRGALLLGAALAAGVGDWSGAVAAGSTWIIVESFVRQRQQKARRGEVALRGSQLQRANVVAQMCKKRYRGELGGIVIGGVPVPRELEPRHLLVTGAPGTGKSVTIAEILDAIRGRGDRAAVGDPKGEYMARFWRAGDVVLNPLDARSAQWSPLAEMRAPEDAALLARSLVPDAEGQDASWHRFAQQFLQGILLHCHSASLDNAAIVHLSLHAKLDELRERLAGTPAAGLLPEKADSPMFHSVRGTASPYIQPLSWLAPNAGAKAFSVRAWARDGAGAAWWNYQDAQISAMRTLIGAQLDLIALGVLEQPADPDCRTWLILDETAAIGRLANLEDFLTRARKSGGCAILGVQAIDQLVRLYGQHSAHTLVSCCGSQLTLACGDANTAEYCSRLLGDHQVSRLTRASGRADHGAQQTSTRQISVERLVLPSELDTHRLPKLCGFLKLGAGDLPIAAVRLTPRDRPIVAAAFEPARPVPPALATPAAPPAVPAPTGSAAPVQTPAPTPASEPELTAQLQALRDASWRDADATAGSAAGTGDAA